MNKFLLLSLFLLAGCDEVERDDFDRMMDVLSVDELFAEAERNYTRKNYIGAIRFYQYLEKQEYLRKITLTDNQRATLQFRKSMLLYLGRMYDAASYEFTVFVNSFPNHPNAADAKQYIGFCLNNRQIEATNKVAESRSDIAGAVTGAAIIGATSYIASK